MKLSAAVVWVSVIGVPYAANATTYNLTLLPPAGGLTGSEAFGINDAGQVVGNSFGYPNAIATIWNGTTPTALGGMGGQLSFAYGINNAGQVVGSSDGSGGGSRFPVIWNGTTPTPLGSLGAPPDGTGFSINARGQVAGSSNFQPVVWNGTTPTPLTALAGVYSAASGINNKGQVVGGIGVYAVIWNGTTPTALGQISGQNSSYANTINNRGQAAGVSYVNNVPRAVLWSAAGGVTNLDTSGGFGSAAYGINDAGLVVGFIHSPGSATQNAFVWNGSQMLDLNTLLAANITGFYMEDAYGINNLGQIVGDGYSPSGGVEAFLLTPVPTPIPTALPLFATGLGALGLLGWRKKRKAQAVAA